MEICLACREPTLLNLDDLQVDCNGNFSETIVIVRSTWTTHKAAALDSLILANIPILVPLVI
jgi:hypothetical protein